MCFFVEGRTAEDLSPVCPSHVVTIYYTCDRDANIYAKGLSVNTPTKNKQGGESRHGKVNHCR